MVGGFRGHEQRPLQPKGEFILFGTTKKRKEQELLYLFVSKYDLSVII